MVKSGKIHGEKITYEDGVGCCIWTQLKEDDEDAGSGLCFDFSGDDLEDMKKVIEQLITTEPKKYVPDEKYEEFKKKQEEKEKKLWYKIYDKLQDIGIHFTPFDWNFRSFWVSRPVAMGKGIKTQHVSKLCDGFYFGPLCITWPR